MKRRFTSICTAAVALSCVVSVAAAPAAQHDAKKTAVHSSKKAPKLSKWQQHVLKELKDSAPGDEYFGRLKMSYLGINNTFHDDSIRAGAYTTDPRLIGSVGFADEALNAWAKKYPNDPQLARSYFLAFEMYRKIWTEQGQQKAWDYAHRVLAKWPNSYFGKILKKDLSIGFTEHYFASPLPCQVLAAGTASPMPSPTPADPAPGAPKVDVLPVPCIAPSPSPVPTGALTPSPAPTKSP